MKLIYTILSILALLVTLTGCSNQKISDNAREQDSTTITTADSNTDINEKSTDAKNFTTTNSGKVENNNNYEITEETYTKKNIKITYPQIKNLTDLKKLDSINKKLKDQALAVIDYYDLSNTNAILNVSYDVELQNSDILSIVYKGYFNSGSAAYPISVFYTSNIHIKEDKNIRLKDYSNVNEVLKKLRESDVESNISATQELAKAQTEYLSTIDDSTLKNMIIDADFSEKKGNIQFPEAFSYKKGNNIIIGIPVPHAIGDYAEFVVDK
ncbi:DUF4163 domain-containing protein [Clostridium saccharoperbutylacetonicum]|uniref:DUF4163 domain-containing protein n=1 Tax=Clostridium saccharoperbutylacetonicum TaxID=36745 RepID=UPI0039E8A61C